jgi:hypothetical protein
MCAFVRCPRFYYWSRVLGLEKPSITRELAMRFGSGVHAAAPWTHAQDRDQAREAFTTVWGDGDAYGDRKRTTAVGHAVIDELLRVHDESCPYEPLPKYDVFNCEAVATSDALNEIEFDVDLGLSKPVTGFIDCIGRDRARGTLSVVEYKTATQIWSSFADLFSLSPQIMSYTLAAKAMGMDMDGAYIEGILVAATKASVMMVPLETSAIALGATLYWWRKHDLDLLACESVDPDGTDLSRWRMELSGCNPYASYGVQGWQCEFEPLCQAGDGWEALREMYHVKERAAAAAGAEGDGV